MSVGKPSSKKENLIDIQELIREAFDQIGKSNTHKITLTCKNTLNLINVAKPEGKISNIF